MRERHLSLCCLHSLSLSTGSANNRFRRPRNLRRLLLFCISPLYPVRISRPGNTGKSDPRLFCPDSVTAAPAGAGESELVLVFGSTMWPSAGPRREGSSTDPATTARSAALSRYPSAGQPPPHTFFITASLALTSSSAARNSDPWRCHCCSSPCPSGMRSLVRVRHRGVLASSAGSAAALSSMTAALVSAMRAQALSLAIRVDLDGPRRQLVRVAQLPLGSGRSRQPCRSDPWLWVAEAVRVEFVRATISAATATTSAIAARATAGHVRERGGVWVAWSRRPLFRGRPVRRRLTEVRWQVPHHAPS